MTLLITAIAAVVSIIVWYCSKRARDLKVGVLCNMYGGASLMWLVDAFYEYMELGTGYFEPVVSDIINDTLLGFSAVVLGLIVWVVVVLVKNPDKVHYFINN